MNTCTPDNDEVATGTSRTRDALRWCAVTLLQPFATDPTRARFWVRHVRVGVALSEVAACLVTAYVVLADRPHRDLVVVFACGVVVLSPCLLLLPIERLSRDARGPLVFYLWSLVVTLVIAVISLLDGGADSPLLWLLVLTLTFAALAYPPAGVVTMGGFMVATYLVVVVVGGSIDPATLTTAAVLVTFTAMTAWVSANHWRSYEQQRHLTERLAAADREREEFVAATSHELRTPVASILGYAELLADAEEGRDVERDTYLRTITRNAERLRDLSEGILDLSRWEAEERAAGAGPSRAEVVRLDEACRRAQETMAPLAARAGVGLQVSAHPVAVLGSSGQLERVVLNLVSNAVKFTPGGGRVTCEVRREEDEAVVRVSDDGIGIAAPDLDRLFTRFFRTEAVRQVAGAGLGLSIVRDIVAAHGGRVEVDSEVGVGTTFTVVLPCGSAPRLDRAGASISTLARPVPPPPDGARLESA